MSPEEAKARMEELRGLESYERNRQIRNEVESIDDGGISEDQEKEYLKEMEELKKYL